MSGKIKDRVITALADIKTRPSEYGTFTLGDFYVTDHGHRALITHAIDKNVEILCAYNGSSVQCKAGQAELLTDFVKSYEAMKVVEDLESKLPKKDKAQILLNQISNHEQTPEKTKSTTRKI